MNEDFSRQFSIYTRGFVGSKREPIRINHGSDDVSVKLQYDTNVYGADKSELAVVNMDIDKYYTAIVRNDLNSFNFEFQEEVLRVLFKAFGTKDFEQWYKVQFTSPSFGEQQMDFLDDCFQFTFNGTRVMSLQNWEALLTASDKKADSAELSQKAKYMFNKTFFRELSTGRSMSMSRMFHSWLSNPNGFSDLLMSCNIMFGVKR